MFAAKNLAAPHIFHVASGESQRDSGLQPRVARNELPWEIVGLAVSTPTGLWRIRGVRGRNPVGVDFVSTVDPRVASRTRQPWAGVRNPFGIETPISAFLRHSPFVLRH